MIGMVLPIQLLVQVEVLMGQLIPTVLHLEEGFMLIGCRIMGQHLFGLKLEMQWACQAFVIGNMAPAKELGVKGQLHNIDTKVAHGKAQESICRQRNLVPSENVRGLEWMTDLHGLHINEAIHMLKHELSVLRSTARAAEERLQVYIYVGTGHHAGGSGMPARLLVAVQHYLLEEECLDYIEPQPGLLQIVIILKPWT